MIAAGCTSKPCSAELSNERAVLANEQTSERASPALYASISGHFYPECRGGGLAVVVAMAMAAVHNGMKWHDFDTLIS